MKNILKAGEIQAIKKNIIVKEDGTIKILNNSIVLNKTDDILLRTNGAVCYGLYKMAEDKCIEFTLKQGFDMPYIGDGIHYLGEGKKEYFTVRYTYWKPIVLAAFKKAYTPEAKAKLIEVYKTLKAEVEAVQNPAAKTEEKKEEVTVMNNTNAKELNTMAMAHKIRIALGLEGHYHVQMKIAMNLAWQVKRGQISLDELLNTKEESVKVAAPTYNAPKTEEVSQAQEERVVTTEDKEEVAVTSTGVVTIYLKSFKGGIAQFCRELDGKDYPFYTCRARNLRDLDDQLSKLMADIIKSAPNNTVINCYGDKSYLYVTNNANLRPIAESKGITLVRSNFIGEVV